METTQQQLPAVIQFDPNTLPATTRELTPPQKGWLGMEFTKRQTFEVLKTSELEIQGLVNGINSVPYTNEALEKMLERHTSVKTSLASAKTKWSLMEGRRKWFTGYLTDNVITPAMEFEKRAKNEIAKAEEHELKMRLAIETETNKAQAKNNEKAAYKAHIENEINRVKVTYIAECEKLVLDAYTLALQTKEPVSGIEKYKGAIMQQLSNIKLSPFTPYKRFHVTDAEANEIIAGICKERGVAGPAQLYVSAPDLQNAVYKIKDVFANYENDLANSKKAIEATQLRSTHVLTEAAQTIQQDTAINDITAKAGTFVFSGTPTVKRKLEVVEENTDVWALAVMSNFMRLFGECREYVRVTKWEKLSIGQMATALGKYMSETGEVLTGLQTKEVTK